MLPERIRLKIIFFVIFAVTIYVLLNFYFFTYYRKTVQLPGRILKILMGGCLLLLLVSPIIGRLLLTYQVTFFPYIIMTIGYIWLVFIFLFFVTHGIINLSFTLVNKFLKSTISCSVHKRQFWSVCTICVSILIYGNYEAKSIVVKRVSLVTDKLPDNIKTVKIAQLSDVHFGPTTTVELAEQIVDIVSNESPDLILSTGDFVDRYMRDKKSIIQVMQKLHAPLGKFAVAGNHEFIAGIDSSTEFIQHIGFTILRHSSHNCSNILNLVGVDDISASRFSGVPNVSEIEAFSNIDSNLYTIFLKHQPRVEALTTPHFDLQLSGHTHAGQIFPFTLLVKLIFPYIAGLYTIDENTKLYVNQGTGSWGPPIRFLIPPEVTIITLSQR